jgi:hypothetical protein
MNENFDKSKGIDFFWYYRPDRDKLESNRVFKCQDIRFDSKMLVGFYIKFDHMISSLKVL